MEPNTLNVFIVHCINSVRWSRKSITRIVISVYSSHFFWRVTKVILYFELWSNT